MKSLIPLTLLVFICSFTITGNHYTHINKSKTLLQSNGFTFFPAKNGTHFHEKRTPALAQVWRTRTYFPKKEIEEYWDKGYIISQLFFANDLWVLVMTENKKYQHQEIMSFDRELPDSYNDVDDPLDGKVTEISYNEDTWEWTFLLSKGSGLYNQKWVRSESFPSKAIEKIWNEGAHITHLRFQNDKWLMLSAKGTNYGMQAWRTRYEFPHADIKELWDKGFHIADISYGNGLWSLFMTKNYGYSLQTWRKTEQFPEKEIEEIWNKGYNITHLSFNNNIWVLVGSK